MDEFEELRRNDPEAYRRLLDSLPDVRDGLNRQQRSLLVTMRRLGVTSSSRTMSTAYVTLNTPSAEEKYHQPEIRTHLREVRFTDGDGEDLAEPERFYTPDLGLTYGEWRWMTPYRK